MEALELLLETIGWLFEVVDFAKYWRFIGALVIGLAVGFWLLGKIPRKAVGRMVAAPVMVTAGALGLIWHRRAGSK